MDGWDRVKTTKTIIACQSDGGGLDSDSYCSDDTPRMFSSLCHVCAVILVLLTLAGIIYCSTIMLKKVGRELSAAAPVNASESMQESQTTNDPFESAYVALRPAVDAVVTQIAAGMLVTETP